MVADFLIYWDLGSLPHGIDSNTARGIHDNGHYQQQHGLTMADHDGGADSPAPCSMVISSVT